jgi:hypothetical protein
MLINPEPYRNAEEVNDEVYAAIRYLELDTIASKQGDDADTPDADRPKENEDNDRGVVICVCLYVALLGCLAVFWLYLRWSWFLAGSEGEVDWSILRSDGISALAAIFGSATEEIKSTVAKRQDTLREFSNISDTGPSAESQTHSILLVFIGSARS